VVWHQRRRINFAVKRRASELTVLLLLQRCSSDVPGNFFPGKISAWSRGRRTVSASAVIFYLEVLKLLHTLAVQKQQREKHFTLTKFGTISSKVVVLFVI
jgi:hypothetical protein